MAHNNESTTKFKVDISELVNGMQTAKRQIALANAEFKSATAGMDNWSKSADGISAKLKQLDSTLSSQKSILSNLEKQYELTAQQMGKDSKEAENLRIKIENQKASIGRTEKEIRKYTSALDDIDKDAKDGAKASEELADSVEKAGKSAEKAEGGFTTMKGALASLVADGIKGAVSGLASLGSELLTDSSSAFAQFSAQTGIATDKMGEYEDAIKNTYTNNFGESLQDVAEKMGKVKEVTGELDASKLQDMTEKAITLEETFGMDMTESLRGAQSLMSHFGMTSEEAFDYLASGAQNGLNYTDELGDNVSEYAGKFAEAGYSAEEYFQLLSNGSQGGAYNLDKVNDAINEATTRLGDGTIGDAIGSFSSGTQDLFKAWQNGDATQKQVIDSIVKDIQNAKTEQDKMNLSAKAFGTMAEDGGTQFIESLSSVGDAFTDVTGKAKELSEVKYDTPQSALQGLGRTLKMELLQPIVDEIMPSMSDCVNALTDMFNGVEGAGDRAGEALQTMVTTGIAKIAEFLPQLVSIGANLVVSLVQGIVSALPSVLDAIVQALPLLTNALLELLPQLVTTLADLITSILDALGTLLPQIVLKIIEIVPQIIDALVQAIPQLIQGAVQFLMAIVDAIPTIVQALVTALPQVIDAIITGLTTGMDALIQGALQLFMAIVDAIPKIIPPIIQAIPTIIDGFINGLLSYFDTLVNGAITLLMALVNAIPQILPPLIEAVPQIVNAIVSGLMNNLPALLSGVLKLYMALIDAIPKICMSLLKAVPSIVTAILKGLATLPTLLGNLFTGVWNSIKAIFNTVGSWFSDKFGEAVKGIKKVFSGIADFFTGVWDSVTKIFKKVGTAIGDAISGSVKSAVNSVLKFATNAINGFIKAINLAIGIINAIPKVNIKKLDLLDAPELARGGVLKKGQVGYLEGDGDEAVVPLDRNTGWLDEVAKRIVDKGGLSGAQAQTVTNNYNYEYKQTNNSPKALNRLEIYRQTRNLTSYGMGAV